jgi:phosphoribosylformimino-5-aminoimidazole carboxamide ribotide isomerase
MIIIPAIDIKDGKCVRLIQGDYNQVTNYGDNPVSQALEWQSLGAEMIHLVDLDGAKEGRLMNGELIRKIAETIEVPIEVGGGIRDTQAVENHVQSGVARVIIGTAAVNNPEWLGQMVKKYGDKICVSIDAKDGKIATEGWLKATDTDAIDFILKLEEMGVKTIVYTDIAKDGMMKGPNFEMYEKISKLSKIDVIASGGVSTLADVKKLKAMNLYGAIIGKALYVGAIDLKEALSC